MPNDEFSLSLALDKLVAHPLSEADDLALIRAATICWYSEVSIEREVRDLLLHERSDLELRRLGYLLERFTRFPCMSNARALECCDVLRKVLPVVREAIGTRQDGRRLDELAISWGLLDGLGLKVQVVLPYQTRHVDPNNLGLPRPRGH